MAAAPRISVLMPLQDEREAGVESVRAWTNRQTADGDLYELIAVAMGQDAALEKAVRPLLRGQDRWITVEGVNEYEAFNVGARAARGEFVFLTEAHCVPEPDCLAATIEELDRNGSSGLRGTSYPVTQGRFGGLELAAVETAIRAEEDQEHWRKVLIHGTAIRRDIYLDAGGVPARYGDFAPWVLSIALERRGERPSFSDRPRLSHVYDGDFEKLEACTRSFMAGEVLYRIEHPEDSTDAYLPWSEEWEGRLEYTRRGAGRALLAGLRLRRGTPGSLFGHAATTLFGPRAPILAASLRAEFARARARITRDPGRKRRSFERFWIQSGRRGRLEGLARTGPSTIDPSAVARIDLTQSLAGLSIGFHEPEVWQRETSFRWTRPLALLLVDVPGDGRIWARLELLTSKWVVDAWVRIAVDDEVVPATVTPESIEFELEGGKRWIALGCKPTRPGGEGPDEARVLGLPVRSLSFRPAGSEVPAMRTVDE